MLANDVDEVFGGVEMEMRFDGSEERDERGERIDSKKERRAVDQSYYVAA